MKKYQWIFWCAILILFFSTDRVFALYSDELVPLKITYTWDCKAGDCSPVPVGATDQNGKDVSSFFQSSASWILYDARDIKKWSPEEKREFLKKFGGGLTSIQSAQDLNGKKFQVNQGLKKETYDFLVNRTPEQVANQKLLVAPDAEIAQALEDGRIIRDFGSIEKYPGFDPNKPEDVTRVTQSISDSLKSGQCPDIFSKLRKADSQRAVDYFKNDLKGRLELPYHLEKSLGSDFKVTGKVLTYPSKTGEDFLITVLEKDKDGKSQRKEMVFHYSGNTFKCQSTVAGQTRFVDLNDPDNAAIGSTYAPEMMTIDGCSKSACVSFIADGTGTDEAMKQYNDETRVGVPHEVWTVASLKPETTSFKLAACAPNGDGTCPGYESCRKKVFSKSEFNVANALADATIYSSGSLAMSYTTKSSMRATPRDGVPPTIMQTQWTQAKEDACKLPVCFARAYFGPKTLLASLDDFEFSNANTIACRPKPDGSCPSAAECNDQKGSVHLKKVEVKDPIFGAPKPGLNGTAGTVH